MFIKVIDVVSIIVEDLNFDVVGVSDYFFQIFFVVFEGGFGFMVVFKNFFFEFFFGKDWVYVVVFIVLGGFEYQWVVDFSSFFVNGVYIVIKNFGCWNNWNVCCNGNFVCVGFIVQFVYGFGFGINKGDFVCNIGVNKFGVFR